MYFFFLLKLFLTHLYTIFYIYFFVKIGGFQNGNNMFPNQKPFVYFKANKINLFVYFIVC